MLAVKFDLFFWQLLSYHYVLELFDSIDYFGLYCDNIIEYFVHDERFLVPSGVSSYICKGLAEHPSYLDYCLIIGFVNSNQFDIEGSFVIFHSSLVLRNLSNG